MGLRLGQVGLAVVGIIVVCNALVGVKASLLGLFWLIIRRRRTSSRHRWVAWLGAAVGLVGHCGVPELVAKERLLAIQQLKQVVDRIEG